MNKQDHRTSNHPKKERHPETKKGPRRAQSVNTLSTLSGQPAPEQGKHVPEVGLEPGSGPCKHWELSKTSAIRGSPADVRPSPVGKVWTVSTPLFCLPMATWTH